MFFLDFEFKIHLLGIKCIFKTPFDVLPLEYGVSSMTSVYDFVGISIFNTHQVRHNVV